MQYKTLSIRKLFMKKILLALGLIVGVSNSYANQDRYHFASSGYMRLDGQSVNGQDASRFAARITDIQNDIAEKQDLLVQVIVQSVCCIPHAAAKIIDLTMPSQKKSVYFLYGNKILQFDQTNMEKNRK